MTRRVLSTLGLWAAIIAILYLFGGTGAILLLTLLALFTQAELYRLLAHVDGCRPLTVFGLVFGAVIMLGSYYAPAAGGLDLFTLAVILLMLAALGRYRLQQEIFPTLFGIVLVPFTLQFYGQLLSIYGFLMLPVWVIAVAKFSDVGGYLIGSRFGKTKLAPMISPGKTVEGAIGGIAMSALVGIVLFLLARNHLPDMGLLRAGIFAAVLGAVAIASDLVESLIKRRAGQKDSGGMIPGIGGAFDLLDSLILCGPLAYLLFKYGL